MNDQHRGIRTVREEFTATDNPRLTLARQAPAYRETSLSNTNLEWTARNLGFVEKLDANAYLMKNERYSADDSKNGYAGNLPGPSTTVIETKGANFNLDSRIGENTLIKYGINYRHQEITLIWRQPLLMQVVFQNRHVYHWQWRLMRFLYEEN